MAYGDYPALMDPQTLGVLSGAFAGLNASGPQRMPTSLGQVIGQAGSQGLNSYMGAWEAQRRDAQTQALVDLERQKLLQAQQQFAIQQGILAESGLLPGVGGGGGVGMPTPGPSPTGAPGVSGGASPRGNDFPFSLPQIAAMRIAGMPDLTATYQAAHPAGIAAQPGAPIVNSRTGEIIAPPAPVPTPGVAYVPDKGNESGWRAVGVPGAAQGAAAQAGAVGAAEAANRTVPVKLADGREIRVPESLLLNPAATPPAVPAGVNVSGSFPSANLNLAGVDKPTLEKAADKNPLLKKTLQEAGVMEDPWTTIPKLAQPTGFGQSTFQSELQKEQAQSASKLAADFGQKANEANARIALNNQALDLIDKADTGPLASKIADVKNILVSRFGIPEEHFANTPSATIALQKDLVNAATQKAKQQFGSRITQSEVMLMLTRGAPNVDMTKAAMKYLVQSDNAMAKYQIQQANDFGKYVSMNGDPMRFEGWYAKNFPATGNLKDVHLDVGNKVRKYNPATGKIE